MASGALQFDAASALPLTQAIRELSGLHSRPWQGQELGAAAAEIGRVEGKDSFVVLQTAMGGERTIEELEDDPLPRIC